MLYINLIKIVLACNLKNYFFVIAYLLMTHKYRGSQQSLREVKPKFIDSTQGEPKNIYKP
jgi:hypothetical protein